MMLKMFDVCERITLLVCSIFLIGFTLLVFIDVVSREIIDIPLLWIMDVSLGLFVWSVFLGAAIGYRRKAHFTVELFAVSNLKLDFVLNIIAIILMMLVITVFIFYGIEFSISGYNQRSMMLGFRRIYVYSSIPVSGFIMFIFTIEHFMQLMGQSKLLRVNSSNNPMVASGDKV